MKTKKTKNKLLFDKAWELQSKYIKLRDSDWRGYGKCCTCDKTIEAMTNKGHAGHYRHGYLDFHKKNVHLQCSSCNIYSGGKLDKYTIFLIKKYGVEVIDELDKAYHEHKRKHELNRKKYTDEELELIIIGLKEKINEYKRI